MNYTQLIVDFFSSVAAERDRAVSTVTDVVDKDTRLEDASLFGRALLAVSCSECDDIVIESALNSMIHVLEMHSLQLGFDRLRLVFPRFSLQCQAHSLYVLGAWGSQDDAAYVREFRSHSDLILREAAFDGLAESRRVD